MKTLKYNYFTTALWLTNFVNEHKIKPEVPDMIPVPVDRYALIHNDHWFTDHCHQRHSVSIIAEVHYFPYSGHYGIKFINGIQTSCPLDELLTAEVVKDGDPGTPKYRKAHNIA